MPLKFGFQRRKSGSNGLEEFITERPQSSFRVLERPPTSQGFHEVPVAARRRTNSEVRPLSESQFMGYEEENLYPRSSTNRGSAGTQLSSSSGLYETSASSLRFSDTSTVPSTSSLTTYDEPLSKPAQIFVPQPSSSISPKFLKTASKAFSFGAKKATEKSKLPIEGPDPTYQTADFEDTPDPNLALRKRATTDLSYIGEGIAPITAYHKDWRLSIKHKEDDFGSMFSQPHQVEKSRSVEALGQQSNISRVQQRSATPQMDLNEPSNLNFDYEPGSPQLLRSDRRNNDSPEPASHVSIGSNGRLISRNPVVDYEEEGYAYRATYEASRHFTESPSRNLTDTASCPLIQSGDLYDEELHSAKDLNPNETKKTGYFSMNHSIRGYQPVSLSMPSPPLEPQPSTEKPHDQQESGVTLYDGEYQDDNIIQQSRQSSFRTNQCNKKTEKRHSTLEPELEADLSFHEMANSAARIEAGEQPIKERPQLSGKVMSAADFERYKRDQELYRSNSNITVESEKQDDDEFDEDDEVERSREVVRQRRRQEAKMSVYRQQMMKVTGEKIKPQATSRLMPKISITNLQGKESASEEEDEDIPLGILAAHGFPSKERPPSHMPSELSSAGIRYASEAYPTPTPAASAGKDLPAFARALPRDPYYGASIVNPQIRESMGYGAGSRAGSVYSESRAASPVPSGGGLIGVIAREEHAKALRKGGASFPQYDGPPLNSPSMNVRASMASNYQGPPPTISPEAQSQIAMNQQMQQMMQMQMQFMQQMMIMQGNQGQGMPAMSMMPGMAIPSPQQGATTQRDYLGDPGLPRPGQKPSVSDFRAATAMRPVSSQRSNRPASVAPLERSNIGQPPRYRPVSIAPREDQTRASTMLSSKPHVSNLARPSVNASSSTPNLPDTRRKSTLRTVARNAVEDEDAAWEELKRKKEGKQKLWRSMKAQTAEGKENSLEGVFYPTEIP